MDGLACSVAANGALQCSDSNLDLAGAAITPFHETTRCIDPKSHYTLAALAPGDEL
ncbi:MAG: hypothetical protein POG24_08145 [Acidocella sp.]|nr:hypothetical protein [Acidocella sp.]